MHEGQQADQAPVAPTQAVGRAIQDLTATRLGRGFVPLTILLVAGLARAFGVLGSTTGGLTLAFGALATAAAMLSYGLRISQLAFGRPERPWMSLAMWGSVVPPVFALYVLGWLGLRGFVAGSGVMGVIGAIFFTAMGAWTMKAWMNVSEVQRLAKVMSMGIPAGSEE